MGQLSSIFTYGFPDPYEPDAAVDDRFVMVTMADRIGAPHHRGASRRAHDRRSRRARARVADGSIDFDHVSFKYSAHAKRQSSNDIDLHIKSGETIGIIGGTRLTRPRS